jgi:hypothetical protein
VFKKGRWSSTNMRSPDYQLQPVKSAKLSAQGKTLTDTLELAGRDRRKLTKFWGNPPKKLYMRILTNHQKTIWKEYKYKRKFKPYFNGNLWRNFPSALIKT